MFWIKETLTQLWQLYSGKLQIMAFETLKLEHFAPGTWKRGTLKTLVERAYIVCSFNELLQKELKYLVKGFYKTNNYPHYVIK